MRFGPRFSTPVFAFIAALLSISAFAAEPIAPMVATATTIEWQTAGDHAAFALSFQLPDGQVRTETFAAGNRPMLRVENLSDGLYSYELRAMPRPAEREDMRIESDAASPMSVQSGSFTVLNGAIVPPNAREATKPRLRFAAETFFADDVSATGGLCGGSDCTNAEAYGSSFVKIKANNTRLKFEDTSTAAGFATTDWQISANDTTSGGANKLFVEDLTTATVPFLIEGGTPSNTLYVDSNGRVGIRTSNPARELTIDAPVVAGIRMEQSASPFQAWDITASQNNFIIRDVNHEQSPFIIQTSAPYYSFVIDSTGRIGLGVSAPLYQIHHSSGARLDAGVWVDASSRTFKQDIHDLDRTAAYDALHSLQPVTFAYKSNPSDQHVGFIAEDVPELVATPDRTGLAPMDVVAVLTKIVQEQQKTIDEMRTRLDKIEHQ